MTSGLTSEAASAIACTHLSSSETEVLAPKSQLWSAHICATTESSSSFGNKTSTHNWQKRSRDSLYVVESALLPLQKIAFRKCKQCINASSGLLMLTFPSESFVNAILKFIRKEFQSLVGHTQKVISFIVSKDLNTMVSCTCS